MNRRNHLYGIAVVAGAAWAAWLAGCAVDTTATAGPPTLAGAEYPVISDGVGRAITWENKTGAPGAGGKERDGRKGSPAIKRIRPGETVTLMDVDGPGIIRHIWITIPNRSPNQLRNLILRMYWDREASPSVEVPLGDFFGTAHGRVACDEKGQPVNFASAWTTEPNGRAFNCFFPMPFDSHAKITVENDTGEDSKAFFFQIDYELMPRLPAHAGRFHAQFRRQNPTIEKQDYVILDNVRGPGMYVGTVIGVRALGPHWWGEGELKMYMDGDTTYPTICGTGSEDYFNAGWGMLLYQTPYHGCTLLLKNDFFKEACVSMYRWHVLDPVRFRKSLKVTIQQIGYNKGLYERSDDWCSTAYWYQFEPHNPFPPLPDREARVAGLIEPVKEAK